MELKKKKLEIANLLTILATAISLLMTVVYATQYAASLEKRVSLLEQHDVQYQDRLIEIRDALYQANNVQDEDQRQFQQDVTGQLTHLDDKIEKIYTLLIARNKQIA
jgi:hypothetical protein